MVLLLEDAKIAGKSSLEEVRSARVEDSRRYHEGLERGRHPRSFPHNGGVWKMIKASSERIVKAQSRVPLHQIVGVDEEEAAALQKKVDAHFKSIATKLESPKHTSSGRSTRSGGSNKSTGSSGRSRGGGSGKKERGSGSASRSGTLFTLSEDQNATAPQLDVHDPVGLAKSYLAQYQDSKARTKMASRRMSDYRHLANSNKNGLAALMGTSNGRPGLARINSRKLIGKDGAAKRSAALKKKNAKHTKKKDMDINTFLASARMKGHHRDNESVLRYIEYAQLQEKSKEKQKSNSERPSTTSSARSRKSTVSQEAKSSFEDFADRTDTLKVEDTDFIELAPRNSSGRLFYGSQIALEYHDGSFLTVSSPNGAISLMKHPFGDPNKAPTTRNYNDDGLTPLAVDKEHSILFTLVNLNDPQYVGPIHSGDDVWLCIHPGQGQFHWKEGSILGSRVIGGADISTVPVDKTGRIQSRKLTREAAAARDRAKRPLSPTTHGSLGGTPTSFHSSSSQSERAGTLVPVLAYIPKLPGHSSGGPEKSLDDMYRDATNIKRIQKLNYTASLLGQWKMCAASNQDIKKYNKQQKGLSSAASMDREGDGTTHTPIPLQNCMPVYLEQDWINLVADEKNDNARDASGARGAGKPNVGSKGGLSSSASASAPPSSNNTKPEAKARNQTAEAYVTMDATLKKMVKNEDTRAQYRVERHAVFHIRHVQPKLPPTSNNGKSVEQILYRARMQLKESKSNRNGAKAHPDGLTSGQQFLKQIRKLRHSVDDSSSSRILEPIDKLEEMRPDYFFKRYRTVVEKNSISNKHVEVELEKKKAAPLLLDWNGLDNQKSLSSLLRASQKGDGKGKGKGKGSMKNRENERNMMMMSMKFKGGNRGMLMQSMKFKSAIKGKKAKAHANIFIKSLTALMEDSDKYRQSTLYVERIDAEPYTPWFEMVHRLRGFDKRLLREARSPLNATSNMSKLKSRTINLIKKTSKHQMLAIKKRKEMERCQKLPIYHRIQEEDKRIIKFVENQKLKKMG